MAAHCTQFTVPTRGRGIYDITNQVQSSVANSGASDALCTVFIHHTSASLIITENADPTVHRDLNAFMDRLVKDGDTLFKHTAEGADDMSAHVRTILTQTSLSIPILNGQCDLGTWQGIYIWEHRFESHQRRVTVLVTH